jgi:hypothetical protein
MVADVPAEVAAETGDMIAAAELRLDWARALGLGGRLPDAIEPVVK